MAFALALAQAKQRTDLIEKDLTNAGELRAEMLTQIQQALKRHGIIIEIDTRNGIARLPESLLFDSGSASFRPGAEQKLQVLASELSTILPCYASGVSRPRTCPAESRTILDAMFVEGHTDSTGIYANNFDLSANRAKAAFFALTNDANLLNRLHNDSGTGQPLMSLSAYGQTRPVAPNNTEDGRRRNRRIDLRFVVGTPRVEDVEHARETGKLPL